MAYASGRTREPFIQRAVLEGRTLYVAPDQFANMQRIIIDNADRPDHANYLALRSVLLRDQDITDHKWTGFDVVIDYDIPGPNERQRRKAST